LTGAVERPISGTIGLMARTETTVVLEDEVLARLRRAADRAGLDDSTVAERALRRFLSLEVVDRVWKRNSADPMDPARSEQFAYGELREARRQ
jgi:hypothetical protein